MNNHFKAPWDTMLKVISFALIILFIVIFALNPSVFLLFILLFIILVASLFIVKGYSINNSHIVVHLLFWNKTFEASNLNSVYSDETVMNGSLRLFGIGGAFSYSGLFWNKKLGRYYAYATDRKKSVVLCFDSKTIIVTPDDPEKFVNTIRTLSV